MKSQYKDRDIAGARRRADRSKTTGAPAQRSRFAPALTALIAAALVFAAGESRAQQRIALAGSAHTTTVMVTLGKSEDVHTDQNLVDISVGDPEVADVNPLTDHALSILGKK
ncbi:MAG TPA: pilus assembly protein N-terminal domain-containing protein, partial [Xanthobacteraceae bacterium]|nr:pilus assembly protein N-terminal domain-containing protein [Xanthobacteraceae bacterium]